MMPLAGAIKIDADIAKVIGIEDTELDDDLLTHSGLKKKNRVRRRRQERKLRQLAQIRSTERRDFEDKLALARIHKVVDTSRRDIADRKPFVTSTFNGSTVLTLFIDDLRTKTYARSG